MKKIPIRIDRDLFLKIKVKVMGIVDVQAETKYTSTAEVVSFPIEANDDNLALEASQIVSPISLPRSKAKAK